MGEMIDFKSISVPHEWTVPVYRDKFSDEVVGHLSGDRAAVSAYIHSLEPFGFTPNHKSGQYCLTLEPLSKGQV